MPEIKTIYQSSESEIKKKEFVQKLQKNVEDMKKIISKMPSVWSMKRVTHSEDEIKNLLEENYGDKS
jgi:hypothetical protein